MNHVFISYSRHDRAYVKRLAEWLTGAGVPVWFDYEIGYGETWTKTIESNLDDAAAVVVVMSSSARESNWVSREVARAERKQKHIFPLLLSGEPMLQFETTQYEDVTDGSLPSPKFADNIATAMGITLRGVGNDLLQVIERYRQSGVLLLGPFTQEGYRVQSALRDSLRERGLIPLLLDFPQPADSSLTETLLILSLAARFIIVDLSSPKNIPLELGAIVSVSRVPIVPLLKAGDRPFAMFDHIARYPWVLPTLVYEDVAELLSAMDSAIIAPAEAKFLELHRTPPIPRTTRKKRPDASAT